MKETPTQIQSWNEVADLLQTAFGTIFPQADFVVEQISTSTAESCFVNGCVVQVDSTETANTWSWCFTKELANFIVDCSLGGNGASHVVRPLTTVDTTLVRKFAGELLNGAAELPAELCVGSDDQLGVTLFESVSDESSTESIYWSVRVGDFESQMAWRLPGSLVNKIAIGPLNHAGVAKPAELTVLLGEVDIPIEEFDRLEVGDTIMLNADVTDPLTAILDGQAYLVEPGSAEGQKAVRRKDEA